MGMRNRKGNHMPRFYHYTVEQLDRILGQIRDKMYTEIMPLKIRG